MKESTVPGNRSRNKKLLCPILVVLVDGTMRLPRLAEHKLLQPGMVDTGTQTLLKHGLEISSTKDGAESYYFHPMHHWYPMQEVVENCHSVQELANTDNQAIAFMTIWSHCKMYAMTLYNRALQ